MEMRPNITEFPVFDGKDGYWWIINVGWYFDGRRIPDAERRPEEAARKGLTGQALKWFRLWNQRNPKVRWFIFEIAFLKRYQPTFRDVLPEIEENEVTDSDLELGSDPEHETQTEADPVLEKAEGETPMEEEVKAEGDSTGAVCEADNIIAPKKQEFEASDQFQWETGVVTGKVTPTKEEIDGVEKKEGVIMFKLKRERVFNQVLSSTDDGLEERSQGLHVQGTLLPPPEPPDLTPSSSLVTDGLCEGWGQSRGA